MRLLLPLWLLLAPACAREAEPPSETREEGAAAPARTIRFRDVTADVGVDFVHDPGATSDKHLPETMGHGVALVDVDEDGDLDLYLVQGGPLVGRERVEAKPRNALFTNRGDGRFDDSTAASGAAADEGYGMGVAAGDANGDGSVDLFVTNDGPDVLLLGDGEGGFEDAGRAELADERWTTGAVFFDAELDGDLDLYVAAYVQVDLEHPTWCGRREPGWRTVCHPDHYPGLQDRLWRNLGAGTFEDATEEAGLSDSWGKGLGVIATDLDADGLPELYVANDSVENRLWHNEGGGRFTDRTLLSGTGVNGVGVTEAGMGVASGDVDADQDLDLFVTNFDNESHTLYVNEGGLSFSDGTAAAGLEAPTRLFVGFGTLLADFDDDGDLDLLVVNGHIVDLIHMYNEAQSYAQPAQLFLNDGAGRFRDGSAAAGDLAREPRVGRGATCGDLDGDGDLDLVLTECGGRARVLANEHEGPAGARAVLLEGAPRGARLLARTSEGALLVREAGPQPSYLSQTAPAVHLGLGHAAARVVALELSEAGVGAPVALPEAGLAPGRWRLERLAGGWSVKGS